MSATFTISKIFNLALDRSRIPQFLDQIKRDNADTLELISDEDTSIGSMPSDIRLKCRMEHIPYPGGHGPPPRPQPDDQIRYDKLIFEIKKQESRFNAKLKTSIWDIVDQASFSKEIRKL